MEIIQAKGYTGLPSSVSAISDLGSEARVAGVSPVSLLNTSCQSFGVMQRVGGRGGRQPIMHMRRR